MQPIQTHIDIDAPPAVVWDVLTDLSSYPQWNPHLTRATGALELGSHLTIRVHRDGAKDREMTVTVTAFEPSRHVAWVGTLGFAWLFKAVHSFELEALGDDRTRLHNREDVSGVLASFVVSNDPARDYEAMNRALKLRVERARTAGAS